MHPIELPLSWRASRAAFQSPGATPKARSARWCAGLVLACIALLACGQAMAGYVHGPAPRLKLNGQAGLRAISMCTDVGLNLPLKYALVLDTASTSFSLPFDIRLEPLGAGSLPAGARLIVNDVGQAELFEYTDTRVRGAGVVFDLQLALDALTIRSPAAGAAHLVIEIGDMNGDTPGVRTELRAVLQFVAGSNAINSTPCDAPPVLLPEDDTGLRADDDYTYVSAPRFSVTSTAANVALLRNGNVVANTAVVGGSAQLPDDGAAGFGLHRYQVQHDARPPSAGRWIELAPAPGPPAQITLPGAGAGRPVGSNTGAATARVTDADGTVLHGVTVSFTLSPGSGGASATFAGGGTQASGISSEYGEAVTPAIITGTLAGTVLLRAEVNAGVFVEQELPVVAGPGVSIERLSGDLQQAAVNANFAAPLVVRVRDQFGNPSGDQSVRYTAPGSGATATFGVTDVIHGLTVVTTADGIAPLVPRAVNAAGAYTISAHLLAQPAQQVTFSARNLRAAPVALQPLTPVASVGWLPGAAVTPLPSVRVVDAGGIAISDVDVRFELIEGGGSIGGAETSASADGVATLASWQLGAVLDQQHRVRVSVQGVAPIEFSARTRAEHDAAVTVANGSDTVVTLSPSTWTVTVTNAGPSTAELALALDHDGIEPIDFACSAQPPSSCSTPGQAGSAAALQLAVAAGGRVDINVRARVTAVVGAHAGLGVGLVAGANGSETNVANDTAVDLDLVLPRPDPVFGDGFE
jgi:hypothetical protein